MPQNDANGSPENAVVPDAGTPLAPDFVALLRCPNCADRPPLAYDAGKATLACARCGRVYPVLDGLPDLRADDEAQNPAGTTRQ